MNASGTAPIVASPACNSSTAAGSSFSNFIDDLDQFMFKDHNDFGLNSNQHHFQAECDQHSFLSTSPTNTCSFGSNLNSNELDLFSFDKINSTFSSNGIFDIYQCGDSPFNNYNSFNLNNPTITTNNNANNAVLNNNNNNINNNNNNNNSNNVECNSNITSNLLNIANPNVNLANFNNSNICFEDEEEEEDEEDSDDDLINENDHDQMLIQDPEFVESMNENFNFGMNEIVDLGSENMINEFGMIAVAANASLSNNDALFAIRELALRDKKTQSRKHKNSTSSISSVSMSSTIKKVAIELQNSAANLVNSSANIPQTTNTFGGHELHEIKTDFVEEFDEENDFEDLLGLDDWEQMLDEDCISRLTADFSTNFASCQANKPLPNNATITTLNSGPLRLPNGLAKSGTTPLQTAKVGPYLSTVGQVNKTNQPLVLVLSSSSSSPSSSPLSKTAKNSNSLTPITSVATAPSNQIKKLNTKPTQIISTTRTSSTQSPSSVVTKLNSVIMGDPSRVGSLMNKSNTITKLDNRAGYSANINLLKTKPNMTTPNITVTTTTTTNNKNINKQVSLGARQPKANQLMNNSSRNLTLNINNSLTGSNSSSPASSSSTSPASINEYCEIIDCVNPDQIFPYRLPLLRFIKTELDSNDEEPNEWSRNKYYPASHTYDVEDECNDEEEEEEEEIDVVSVNNNNLNLNMHNYFPLPHAKKPAKKQQHQNQQMEADNGSATSSLLANYLKSSSSSQNKLAALSVNNSSTAPLVLTKTISNKAADENSATNTLTTTGRKQNNFIKTTKLNNNTGSSNLSLFFVVE